MVLDSKEAFEKYYESLDSDFDKKMFLIAYQLTTSQGKVYDTEENIDRFTADEFKVYYPRLQRRISEESQKEIDKNYEDSLDELMDEVSEDVDFQINNLFE